MQQFHFQGFVRRNTLTGMHILICVMFLLRGNMKKKPKLMIALKNLRYICTMENYATKKNEVASCILTINNGGLEKL